MTEPSKPVFMQQRKRIVGVGRIVLDHVVELPAYPKCDTKCLVMDHWEQLGGPVPVALSTAQYYGVETEFLGIWGDDADGRELAQELSRRGIEIGRCPTRGATGFAQIWTESRTGRRTIAAHPGPELSTKELASLRQAVAISQILHLDGSSVEVAITLAQQMQQQKGIVVLDAGSKKPGMESLLPWVDHLIASDLFCRSWFGYTDVGRDELLALGCAAVIRTRGGEGATFYDEQREIHEPAVDVQVVDTNGAGDVFSGAWLRGLAAGWAPQRTLVFANRVAGHSCGHRGNSTLPSAHLTM